MNGQCKDINLTLRARVQQICLKPTKQFKVKSSLLRNYLSWRVTSLFLALARHLHATHKPTRHTIYLYYTLTTAKTHAETDKPKCTITSSDYLICIAFVFFLSATWRERNKKKNKNGKRNASDFLAQIKWITNQRWCREINAIQKS